mmetsp:Transcript_8157/g.19385  ORF Transcript_8157/g.19385 Transcript_8157/m.19385 type:complete len:211 (-) Transcript_8157:204-836(-)|eukprot:Transcript_11021.p3 GENE.Transcript_11021~~Transcript_11021.p3  ORF type:complete len:211 (-),score=62.17 Transcript_11021:290-922(-)
MLSLFAQPLSFNTPTAVVRSVTPAAASLRMGVADMEGVGVETGGKVFDPLGLSKIASAETLAWYRAAELKHSRVAMAAVTGWAWVSSGGPLFPGYLSPSEGVTFESLGTHGYAAWDAVPENGKFQILGVIGILELLGEAAVKPHYMSGGTPGKIPLIWDPLGFTAKLSPEALARKRNSELKNGRLAMIGVASMVSGHFIPDSVPLLPTGM